MFFCVLHGTMMFYFNLYFRKPQYCYIVNDHKGEVLDVQGEKSAPGTKVRSRTLLFLNMTRDHIHYF